MMARLVSETLTLSRTSYTRNSLSSSNSWSSSRWLLKSMCPGGILSSSHRHGSNQSGKGQLMELDLDSSSSSNSNNEEVEVEVEVLGIKKLEDVIHNIIVKRSAPDWLPFLPGSSYWVPPHPIRRSHVGGAGIIQLLGRLAHPLSPEESLSLSTVRGWPSSSFFIPPPHGTSSTQGIPVEVKEGKMAEKNSDDVPPSDDEE